MSKKKRHTKSFRQKLFSAFWLVLSLSLVCLGVFAGIYYEKNTTINELRFSGNSFTDDSTLLRSVISPVGMLADSVDYAMLYATLNELPYVKEVTASMNIRGILTLRVVEREPLALLVNGDRKIYVAEGGIKLPIIPGKIRNVPLLYGFAVQPAADTLQSEPYKQIEQFLTEAKSNEIGWVTISEVAWNNTEGVVALTYENGVKLIFGKDDFREKMLNWEAFYTNIAAQKGIHSFASVDLRFRNQVVTQNL